jgi:O-antigen/teichoic acid export membrane protein
LRAVLRDARGSLLYYVASTTQTGLQPYVAAAISPDTVSIAVPGRTLANSARNVSTAVVNVVWVPVAARLFELKSDTERLRFWKRNSPILATIQMAGIVALLALAPVVVPRWLPSKSNAILELLPFYCIEQAVYVATMPSFVLLQAVGRFGTLGAATMAAALATIAGTIALLPSYGAVGFAAASAAAALLIFAPAVLIVEWRYWRTRRVSAASVLVPRMAWCLAVVGCALPYVHHPWATVSVLAALVFAAAGYAVRTRRAP